MYWADCLSPATQGLRRSLREDKDSSSREVIYFPPIQGPFHPPLSCLEMTTRWFPNEWDWNPRPSWEKQTEGSVEANQALLLQDSSHCTAVRSHTRLSTRGASPPGGELPLLWVLPTNECWASHKWPLLLGCQSRLSGGISEHGTGRQTWQFWVIFPIESRAVAFCERSPISPSDSEAHSVDLECSLISFKLSLLWFQPTQILPLLLLGMLPCR